MFDIAFFAQPILTGFLTSVVLCWLIIKASKTKYILNFVCNNKCNRGHISRFGGISIIIGLGLALFLNKYIYFDKIVWSIILGGIIILVFGIIDDIVQLDWKIQMLGQVVVVFLVFLMGVRVEFISNPFGGIISFSNPILGLLFMLFWMLIIMNAVNWCDGIDGLAGGVVIIVGLAIFFISLQPHVNQPPIAIITLALVGSVGGFLVFNIPKAQIFAGSSGAYFMGFVVALLAISAGAKIGTTMVTLAVILVDFVWVIFTRIYNKKSIFAKDKNHLHHRLMNERWSVRQILLLYYSITLVCAFVAVTNDSIGKIVFLTLFVVTLLVFFIIFKNFSKNI